MQDVFVHMYRGGLHPSYMTKSAYEEARNTWLCTGCRLPRPETEAVDMQVVSKTLPRRKGVVLSSVPAVGVSLIHRDLLTALPATAVSNDLWLGTVYDEMGKRIDAWKTFRGRHRLIVRGSKHASFRRCEECGQLLYFAMGKPYLYPSPPEGITLFGSDLCGLIMHERTFEELPVRSWLKVIVERLPVLSRPRDGLGDLC